MGSSPWGSVRELPSGRFQARYCVDLVWHSAPATFRTRREADAYLASVRSDVESRSRDGTTMERRPAGYIVHT